MPIILSHVSYVYEPGTAMEAPGITDVSLTVREGEMLAIIGHTGSGKSTLIQHLNGLLLPTEGKVFWNGRDITEKGFDRRAFRGRVGLVFQYPEYQLFETDVLTDVCFGPKNQGLSKEECTERAREAMRSVGLSEAYEKRSPFELSGGEKRRAAIAGVLAMQPDIMILDEPTAGLDPGGREEIMARLCALRDGGMGIVIVSHNMDDVGRYADRAAVMEHGKLVLEGTPREVFRREELLRGAGLEVPELTRLMRKLSAGGLPVDTDAVRPEEAAASILHCF